MIRILRLQVRLSGSCRLGPFEGLPVRWRPLRPAGQAGLGQTEGFVRYWRELPVEPLSSLRLEAIALETAGHQSSPANRLCAPAGNQPPERLRDIRRLEG